MCVKRFIAGAGRLPKEYWPCPLCLTTLLEAHGQGTVHHEVAFEALLASGLVDHWPGVPGRVGTTERGRMFVEMLLATPLPEQKWIDPRQPVGTPTAEHHWSK